MKEDTYKGVKSDRVLVCPHCGAEAPQKLSFHHCPKRKGEKKSRAFTVYWISICQACNELVVWGDDTFRGLVGFHSGNLVPVYPDTNIEVDAVPDRVRKIYSEACRIRELAPNGFSVLVRRALEAICEDKGIKDGVLATRLKELTSQEQFPKSIAGLTNVIRLVGNIGAHAGSVDVSLDQARLLDNFFRFVIEFVYVLPARLSSFETSLKAGAP